MQQSHPGSMSNSGRSAQASVPQVGHPEKQAYASPSMTPYGDIRGVTMGVGTKDPDFGQSGTGNDEGNG